MDYFSSVLMCADTEKTSGSVGLNLCPTEYPVFQLKPMSLLLKNDFSDKQAVCFLDKIGQISLRAEKSLDRRQIFTNPLYKMRKKLELSLLAFLKGVTEKMVQ